MESLTPYIIGVFINWLFGLLIIGLLWTRSSTVRAWFDAIENMPTTYTGRLVFGVFFRILCPSLWIVPLVMYYVFVSEKETFRRHD